MNQQEGTEKISVSHTTSLSFSEKDLRRKESRLFSTRLRFRWNTSPLTLGCLWPRWVHCSLSNQKEAACMYKPPHGRYVSNNKDVLERCCAWNFNFYPFSRKKLWVWNVNIILRSFKIYLLISSCFMCFYKCVFPVHRVIVEPWRRPCWAAADQPERLPVQAGFSRKPSLPPGQSQALL